MKTPTYNEIKPYISKKLVTEQRHPDFPELAIFNYSHQCQFEKAWDDVTMQCRGLILNTDTGEVVARPFPKFFNLSEHTDEVRGELELQMNEEPLIYEKYDGSLGIGYRTPDGRFAIATRGSFTSDQAAWATKWIHQNIPGINSMPGVTPLFEIICDTNRIVVKYDFEGLVYLTTIDNATGKSMEHGTMHPSMGIAQEIHHTDWRGLQQLAEDNKEGFVLFFPHSNIRVKVKFDEYKRLHRIMTGVSKLGLWEHLRDHGIESDITDFIQNVPDEFYDWARENTDDMRKKYWSIYKSAVLEYNQIISDMDIVSRKEFAERAKKSKLTHHLFALYTYNQKSMNKMIMAAIRPYGKQGVFVEDIDA